MPQTHQGTWQNQVGRIPECLVQCLTKIHLIGTMSLGVLTCRVLSGTWHSCVGLGQTHWLESWTSQITLSGVPICCVLFSVIYVWPHLVCVPDTSESCQSWYLLLSMSLGVPTCMTCSQTQQQWCGLLCWHYGWNQCSWWWCWSRVVYTCGGVCLAVIKSISLGVLWWCVGLAGNNFSSLGVLCALSLYSFPRPFRQHPWSRQYAFSLVTLKWIRICPDFVHELTIRPTSDATTLLSYPSHVSVLLQLCKIKCRTSWFYCIYYNALLLLSYCTWLLLPCRQVLNTSISYINGDIM